MLLLALFAALISLSSTQYTFSANYGNRQYGQASSPSAPVDTPEVQAAKAAHFRAYTEAASRTGPQNYNPNGAYNPNDAYNPNQAYNPNGAYNPNQAYNPSQAYNQNGAYNPNQAYNPNGAYNLKQAYNPQYSSGTYPQPLSSSAPYAPAYNSNYQPMQVQDTPEVQAAKAAHFQAYAKAAAAAEAAPDYNVQQEGPFDHGNGQYSQGTNSPHHGGGQYNHGNAQYNNYQQATLQYNHGTGNLDNYSPSHAGYLPVQVQDTPEVQAAKTAHFQALAQAKAAAG